MAFQHTLEALQKQAGDISSLAATMAEEAEIRNIDIDLLLHKLRDIYDIALELKTAPAGTPAEALAKNTLPPEITEEPIHYQTNTITETIPDEKAEEIVFEVAATPESEPESEAEVQAKIEPEPKPIQPEPDPTNESETALLADQFGNTPTLNEEILDGQKIPDLSSQMQSQPINSITGAIGLNEKFELINELFHGDTNAYTNTMEAINQFKSFVEAYAYLEESLKWDMENTYVQRILELVRRKLIVHRNEQ